MYFLEKNNTIVKFPIKSLSLDEYYTEQTIEKNLAYDLLVNIIHDGKPTSGSYRVQVKQKSIDKWFEIQDLDINKILPEEVIMSQIHIIQYMKAKKINKIKII